MIADIPFHVPLKFMADFEAGALIRFGSLLKNASNGQIVAHLQESGVTQSLVSGFISSGGSPLGMTANALSQVVSAGASVYTAMEVNKIKEMIESLQVLQYATLGASLVGVGVTLGGFAYMRSRLNTVDKNIQKISTDIHEGFQEIHKANLRREIAKTNSFIEKAKSAWTMNNPNPEYHRIAEGMNEQAHFFESEISHLLGKDGLNIDPDLFCELVQLYVMCNGTVIDCRIRTNELLNAREVSESVSMRYRKYFDLIHAGRFQGDLNRASRIVKNLRDVTDSSLTKPYLIEHLINTKVDGSTYLNRLDKEKRHPILLLSIK